MCQVNKNWATLTDYVNESVNKYEEESFEQVNYVNYGGNNAYGNQGQMRHYYGNNAYYIGQPPGYHSQNQNQE